MHVHILIYTHMHATTISIERGTKLERGVGYMPIFRRRKKEERSDFVRFLLQSQKIKYKKDDKATIKKLLTNQSTSVDSY